MSTIEKIIRIVIIVGIAIYLILAIKDNDWTQGIFWLLTILSLTYLPGIKFKDKK